MINITDKPLRLPVGVSDFEKLATLDYHFVDKTLFIKDIVQDGADVILITRPRRFGKTLSMSMLYYFLQCQRNLDQNLFEDLTISQDKSFCEKHQNKYPVIFVSLKEIKQSSYEQAYASIAKLMSDLYEQHIYLLDEGHLREHAEIYFKSILNKCAVRTDLEGAIQKLSYYIKEKFGKKPIILIDEYDTPVQQAYLNGYYDPMIELMRNIFGSSLKDNTFMHKAVITGISRVAQESFFSGVNNFEVYSLLREEYGQYFGFLESEVTQLITKTGNKVSIDAVREWYNGYKIGDHTVYNPWSIISCLKNKGILKAYWLNTSSNELLRIWVESANFRVRQYFELLMQGEVIERPLMENLIFRDLEKREDAIWSLLLYTGYLKVLDSELKGFRLMAQLSVPNKEVMFIYEDIVAQWFVRETSVDFYDDFIHGLTSDRLDKFKLSLSTYLMESGSYFDFNKNTPEQVFHSFMLGLIVGLKKDYVIKSNQESGLGRFDVVFIPKDHKRDGILLEFKVGGSDKLLQKAQEALQQIKDQKYLTIFKSHGVKFVLAIGMAFCGKEVELAHERLEIK